MPRRYLTALVAPPLLAPAPSSAATVSTDCAVKGCFADGVLVVADPGEANRIRVTGGAPRSRSPTRARRCGPARACAATDDGAVRCEDVDLVIVRAGDGNDVVELAATADMGPSLLDGGPGDDVVTGGEGPDTVGGGSGDDILAASDLGAVAAGDDEGGLDGGPGDDRLIGGRGNDHTTPLEAATASAPARVTTSSTSRSARPGAAAPSTAGAGTTSPTSPVRGTCSAGASRSSRWTRSGPSSRSGRLGALSGSPDSRTPSA